MFFKKPCSVNKISKENFKHPVCVIKPLIRSKIIIFNTVQVKMEKISNLILLKMVIFSRTWTIFPRNVLQNYPLYKTKRYLI